MQIIQTVVNRFFPTVVADTEPLSFDLWRLPNDPDSPHVAAMRELFIDVFGMSAPTFDSFLHPEEGTYRRLIVAAHKQVIGAGILYQMADNQHRPEAERLDGGYIAFIATKKKVRSKGAGRALLALAEADFIVNGHTVSRLVRLDPRHTAFFEAAGYQATPGGQYGDMHKELDTSPESRAAAQESLNSLMTLY